MRQFFYAQAVCFESLAQQVTDRHTAPNLTGGEIDNLKLQLVLRESALDHYRSADELEIRLSEFEPPSQSNGGEPSGTENCALSNLNVRDRLATRLRKRRRRGMPRLKSYSRAAEHLHRDSKDSSIALKVS